MRRKFSNLSSRVCSRCLRPMMRRRSKLGHFDECGWCGRKTNVVFEQVPLIPMVRR
jgi:hypothetical protein